MLQRSGPAAKSRQGFVSWSRGAFIGKVFFQSPKSGGRSRQGAPSAQVPKHGVRKQPIVPGRPALSTWPSRQVRLKKFPNPVGNVVASMRCRHIPSPHVHSHSTNLIPCYHFDDVPLKRYLVKSTCRGPCRELPQFPGSGYAGPPLGWCRRWHRAGR